MSSFPLTNSYFSRWLKPPARYVPSGKHTQNYGKSPFLMGKSTISMAIIWVPIEEPYFPDEKTEAQSLVRFGPWRLYGLPECLAGVPWKRSRGSGEKKKAEGAGVDWLKSMWSSFLRIQISHFLFGLCNVLCVFIMCIYEPGPRKPAQPSPLIPPGGTASRYLQHLGCTASHLHVIGSSWEPQPRHWTLSSCIFLPVLPIGYLTHDWPVIACRLYTQSVPMHTYIHLYTPLWPLWVWEVASAVFFSGINI